jgi:hypothetical protein
MVWNQLSLMLLAVPKLECEKCVSVCAEWNGIELISHPYKCRIIFLTDCFNNFLSGLLLRQLL